MGKIFPEWVTAPGQGKSSGRITTYSLWTGMFRVGISSNSNKSPTRCNDFPIYYPDVYLQLNMFRAFSRPSSVAQ
jgi:hypothetical protein